MERMACPRSRLGAVPASPSGEADSSLALVVKVRLGRRRASGRVDIGRLHGAVYLACFWYRKSRAGAAPLRRCGRPCPTPPIRAAPATPCGWGGTGPAPGGRARPGVGKVLCEWMNGRLAKVRPPAMFDFTTPSFDLWSGSMDAYRAFWVDPGGWSVAEITALNAVVRAS